MKIMMTPNKKLVYSNIERNVNGRNVIFFGFVKSVTNMTATMQIVARELLKVLFNTWTENFEFIQRLSGEYSYYSLSHTVNAAYKFVEEKVINPEKVKMSITAVCIFPDECKTFWINTGDDMVYLFGRDKLYRCSSTNKSIKTARERNIFHRRKEWEAIEGGVKKEPGIFAVVSAGCKEYFEKCCMEGEEITTKKLKEFAKGKRKPALIAEISAYN